MQIDIYAPQPTYTLKQFDNTLRLNQPEYIKSNIKSKLDIFLATRDFCTLNLEDKVWVYNENINLAFDTVNGIFNMWKHDGKEFKLVDSFIYQ